MNSEIVELTALLLAAFLFFVFIIGRIFVIMINNGNRSTVKSDIPNITSPLRVNRIIRSKYHAGDYTVKNEALHHYLFEIDGENITLSIVEALSAIEAIEEREGSQ